MSTPEIQALLGETLINFSSNGAYPEEDAVSASYVEDGALPAALKELSNAKLSLEVCSPFILNGCVGQVANFADAFTGLHDTDCACVQTEIRSLSHDSAADVEAWIIHAQGLQDDIDKSRRLANEIVRQAEAEETRAEAFQEQELHVAFLEKEAAFNSQLGEALNALKESNDSLERAENFAYAKDFHEALRALEGKGFVETRVLEAHFLTGSSDSNNRLRYSCRTNNSGHEIAGYKMRRAQ